MRKLPLERDVSQSEDRDPVCGMRVAIDAAPAAAAVAGATYYFCCDACREEFLGNPGHYLIRERAGGRWALTAEEPPPQLRH